MVKGRERRGENRSYKVGEGEGGPTNERRNKRGGRGNKNAKALRLHSVILLCAFFFFKSYFGRLFLTEITINIKNHGYIRDWQVKIYKNPWFVFDFTSLEFLTVFSTALLTGI